MRAPTDLMASQRLCLQNPITLGIRISTYRFWGDTYLVYNSDRKHWMYHSTNGLVCPEYSKIAGHHLHLSAPCFRQWSPRCRHIQVAYLLKPAEVVLFFWGFFYYISTVLPVLVLFVISNPSSDLLFFQFVKITNSWFSGTGNWTLLSTFSQPHMWQHSLCVAVQIRDHVCRAQWRGLWQDMSCPCPTPSWALIGMLWTCLFILQIVPPRFIVSKSLMSTFSEAIVKPSFPDSFLKISPIVE